MTLRVLLVEADAAFAHQASTWLSGSQEDQFEVRVSGDLASALAALEQDGLDVVLLDLELPDSAGLDTFLRLHTYAPRVPVVVLARPVDEQAARWAVAAGAIDYVLRERADADALRWVLSYAVERTAFLAAEERLERDGLLFLERLGAALAESLDVTATAQRVTDLAVPMLGDICAVVLVEPDGAHRLAAAASASLGTGRRMQPGETPPLLELPAPLADVLRTRQPVTCAPLADEEVWASVLRPALNGQSADLGWHAALCVPLLAHGALLGVMCLLGTDPARPFGAQDISLAQLVASRAALALNNARLHAELQAALAARDALLASVAHDLRNPLTSLRLFTYQARVLVQRTLPDDPADSDPILEMLDHNDAIMVRMDGLIQELVDTAQLRAGGQLTLLTRPTDLAALLRSATRLHDLRDHPLRLDVPDEPLVAEVDSLRLARVLDNLLSNAVKYSPAGAEIAVSLAPEAGPRGRDAVLRVRDHGIGIPTEDLPHVFEQFRRAANSTGKIAGTGLGLWGARHIVGAHGGQITLASEEGAGTTVTVRLPLAGPVPTQAA